MTCSVKYRGNVAPTMLWNEISHNYITSTYFSNNTNDNTVATSSVVLPASEVMKSSQFIFSARTIWNISSGPVYINVSWSSPMIKILGM